MQELSLTVAKLAAVNEHRASLIQYRDRQIVAALRGGAKWVEIQDVTGLSPRGVALAVKRNGG